MGFTSSGWLRSYLQGAAIGCLFALGVAALTLVCGEIDYHGVSLSFSLAPLIAALLLSMVKIREEVIFRGWFLTTPYSLRNPWRAVLWGSVVFALMHGGNHHVTLLSLVNLLLFSIFLSELFLIKKSIWIVAALHSMWNFTQGKVLGLPVSGGSPTHSLLHFEAHPDSLTAGFGLEGNLITLGALCIAVAWASSTLMRRQRNSCPSTASDAGCEANKNGEN